MEDQVDTMKKDLTAVHFARLAEGCMGQGYGEYWYGEEGFLTRLPFMTYDPYYECWGWALFMAGASSTGHFAAR